MQCAAQAENFVRCTYRTLSKIFREATKQCVNFKIFIQPLGREILSSGNQLLLLRVGLDRIFGQR